MSVAATAIRIGPFPVTESHEHRANQLERVFDRTADGLYRFILIRVMGRRDVADDLLQQTCCVVADGRKKFSDDDACEAWMRGVARNLIKAHWRQVKKTNGWIDLDDAEQSRRLLRELESQVWPQDELVREETVTRLLHAVTALPAAQQQLVFDFYFAGRSQSDLSEELGVSTKSVESRLYRIRGRLRAILDQGERTDES